MIQISLVLHDYIFSVFLFALLLCFLRWYVFHNSFNGHAFFVHYFYIIVHSLYLHQSLWCLWFTQVSYLVFVCLLANIHRPVTFDGFWESSEIIFWVDSELKRIRSDFKLHLYHIWHELKTMQSSASCDNIYKTASSWRMQIGCKHKYYANWMQQKCK